MKRMIFVAVMALFLVSLVTSKQIAAGPSGPSANGDFQFSLNDGQIRYLKFDVRTNKNGETKGEMTFSDPAGDPGSDEGSATGAAGVFVKAEFECLQVRGHDAVMGGVITESNFPAAVGAKVLLVVQDNGEGINAASVDKLTWGIYNERKHNWVPQDAERDDDNGAFLSWIATDFERDDDVGVPSNKSTIVSCDSFPLSSYSLVEVDHGFGNIQVRP